MWHSRNNFARVLISSNKMFKLYNVTNYDKTTKIMKTIHQTMIKAGFSTRRNMMLCIESHKGFPSPTELTCWQLQYPKLRKFRASLSFFNLVLHLPGLLINFLLFFQHNRLLLHLPTSAEGIEVRGRSLKSWNDSEDKTIYQSLLLKLK